MNATDLTSVAHRHFSDLTTRILDQEDELAKLRAELEDVTTERDQERDRFAAEVSMANQRASHYEGLYTAERNRCAKYEAEVAAFKTRMRQVGEIILALMQAPPAEYRSPEEPARELARIGAEIRSTINGTGADDGKISSVIKRIGGGEDGEIIQ